MNSLLVKHKDEIARLCEKYGVAKLEVFSLLNSAEFDLARDEFEFIADLREGGDIFLRYTDFALALEDLLGNKVVLVDETRLKPRFLTAIAESREVVFASADRTIAA